MQTRLLLTLFLIILISISTAHSQDVREFRIDTVSGVFEPTPVGVDQMKYIGNRYITSEDSTFMEYVTLIVQRDLDFYADFELIPLDTFYLRTYEISDLSFFGWQRLGAKYLLRLEAEFPGKNLRAYWRLYHAPTQREISSGKIEYNSGYWREIGHDIANEVVHTLTGEQGIFRTKVAYIKKIGQAKEVFVSDYDGNHERQITETGTINLSPIFAPNEEVIYFTSYLDGDPQLYRVVVETSEVSKVGSFKGIVAAPAISPDGDKIACVLSKDGNSEIYVLDLEGNIIKRLTRNGSIDSAPSWSPDGQSIAFSSSRTGVPQIYTMDADGLNVKRLTYQGSYNDSPIWSERGDRVTFVSRTRRGRFDLASIRTDGTDYRILTEVGMNENPHFAPDGKHIIFASSRLSEGDIYTMDLSGRNQRRLTRSGNCSNPSWGPIR
ncbi:MAG: Tol-Pal system beta propeller repeat protein TolB [Candidatus Zixiibacteriota bacterium]|nr:MAG: Tol-Pal system beta propeller repeat protein TolB [candidate division Zixibacteria bacterium]